MIYAFYFVCFIVIVSFVEGFTLNIQKQSFIRLYAGGFGKSATKKLETTLAPSDSSLPCGCGSGGSYATCCQPYHDGKDIPGHPVDVVRSRFSALKYRIPDYVVSTTHPDNKEFVAADRTGKRKAWIKSLVSFSDDFDFVDLSFADEGSIEGDTATIAFSATLKQKSTDKEDDILETSTFKKVDNKWLYIDAQIENPFKSNAQVPASPMKQRMISTTARGVPKGNKS